MTTFITILDIINNDRLSAEEKLMGIEWICQSEIDEESFSVDLPSNEEESTDPMSSDVETEPTLSVDLAASKGTKEDPIDCDK